MRIVLGVSLQLSFLLAIMAAGSCGKAAPGSAIDDSGTPTGGDGGGTVPCGDGATQISCCPDDVVAGGACNASELGDCWTACVNGYRGQLFCSNERWTAGKGVFPCGPGTASDAGPTMEDAGGDR